MALSAWQGDFVFSHTVAIFRGHVGDNKRHSHWAAQLTLALEGEVEFETAEGMQTAEAVYLPSKTPHRLASGFICSIYFDALSTNIPRTLQSYQHGVALTRAMLPPEIADINANTDLRALLQTPWFAEQQLTASGDRLEAVIDALKVQLARGEDMDRDALAARVHLSPTRFSHWFVERTGVPLRSYKKWLKLRVVVDAVLSGKSPMEAAMLGGFSDLAHMGRAFAESFGFTYTDALRAWQAMQMHRNTG